MRVLDRIVSDKGPIARAPVVADASVLVDDKTCHTE